MLWKVCNELEAAGRQVSVSTVKCVLNQYILRGCWARKTLLLLKAGLKCQDKGWSDGDVKRCEFSLYNVHLNCYRFFKVSLVLGGLFLFFSGLCSLQYKAERLGWSDSLLLQTEAVLIADYSREQIDYRYVLYMTPLQKTWTIPLRSVSAKLMNLNSNSANMDVATKKLKMLKTWEDLYNHHNHVAHDYRSVATPGSPVRL